MNLTEFKELVEQMITLIQELRATHAADTRADTEKVSVWAMLIGVLFGVNPS